jgi:phosphopantetheine adenylyltransferase
MRADEVRNFLERLCGPSMVLDIFELDNPAGKAATDKELEACILTKEVSKGGQIINGMRSDNNL